ncbi:LysR family transcriptional regulator [Inquilinus limosus]|uniref:LysR substrate-binding domain-containing protein n=1 Tax=Inquilinus limosus TaxID=171674 RepID=UPI003F136451
MQKTQPDPLRLPLNSLLFFESAARHGSFTLAAAELFVTPGAASRQVKSLESALGVTLFRRRHNSIELTEAGRTFLAHVNGALALIRTGAAEITPNRSTLTIRAPLTLTQRWLIPRIGSFRQGHPGIDLWVRSIIEPGHEGPDVEIRYARADAAKAEGEIFLPDRTIPVCHPRLLGADARPERPSDILRLPVLLDTLDGWSWHRWCEAAGIPFRPLGGSITFDTDEAAIDACLSGLGVAQANAAFVDRHLQSGELLPLCPQIEAIVGTYRTLARKPGRAADAFIVWLKGFHI